MRNPIKLLKRRRIIEWGIPSGIILIVAITIITNNHKDVYKMKTSSK